MSTTTSTETTTRKSLLPFGSISLKALPMDSGTANGFSAASSSSATNGSAGPSFGSTISTLRALYPRAAHALLQRDFALTQSLLESAFALLSPPVGVLSVPDALDMHRRKWEILRITLETSAFASPPASKRSIAGDVLPPSLRANLMLSAPGLITALHARSTRLFTPKQLSPKASFLPAQILVPLVLSSLKLHCPDVSRSMIEDWLALRDSVESTRADLEGYERVVELFCLHVLPRIHEWEYAQEFLEYESELPDETREHFKSALRSLRNQEIDAARSIPSPPPPHSPSSSSSPDLRTPSPSPSVGSDSSSDTDDTHSTRTVVPHTSRAKQGLNGLAPLTPTPSGSSTSLTDSKYTNGHAVRTKRAVSPASTARASTSFRGRSSALSTDPQRHTVNARNLPSTLSLVLSTFRAHLTQLGPSRLLFAILCVLLPLFSFLRARWWRKQQTGGSAGTGVEAVRRRLAGRPQGGVISTVWSELVRAVGDAVRMAGGGLV